MINVLIMLGVFIGAGLLILQLFCQLHKNWQKIIGESFFVGIFIVALINNASQYLDININQKYFFYCFLIVSSLTIVFGLFKQYKLNKDMLLSINYKSISPLYFLILLVTIVHLYYIIEQNSLLPLTPWDAWSAWVAKSKIWYAHGINQLIVNQAEWFEIIGSMTNQAEHYPDGLSLIYVFNAGFIGWNETDLNSIYPAMFIALLLMFYGNIKELIDKKFAIVALAVLITLPFVNVHIILAGYADIWIASFLLMIILNFQQYILKRNIYNLILVVVNLLLLIMFKQEGVIWAGIVLSSFFLVQLKCKTRRVLYLILLIVTIIWYYSGGFEIDFPFGKLAITPELIIFPGLGKYSLNFVNTFPAWFEAMFLSKNWHLLWYSIPIVFVLILKNNEKQLLLLPLIFLIQASLFLFVIFSFSYATIFANSFTSINRMVLHIVPTYLYFLFQVIYQYQNQREINSDSL